MHRLVLGAVVAWFVGALVIGGTYAWVHFRPTFSASYTLKLATGPVADAGQKVASTFLREVTSEHRFVKIVMFETASLDESAKALMDGRADLAVVRSDNEVALQGRTIFILRKIAMVIVLPPKSTIDAAQALLGKKIGIVGPAQADDPIIKTFTGFYGIQPSHLVPLPPGEVGSAMKQARVSAALVLGQVAPVGPIAETFANVRKVFKATPSFLDIGESEAIAARSPAYEELEIPAGTFGGAPPEPTESINTIALTVRLLSRASLPDLFAGEITRLLIVTKRQLFNVLPAVAQMEAPDSDKGTMLPVHSGTQAFLNGEQVTLLSQSLNLYWYSGMAAAILGPAAGYAISLVRRRNETEVRAKLLRIFELFQLAKTVALDELDEIDRELENLQEWFFQLMAKRGLDRDQFNAIDRMVSQVQTAIERRKLANKNRATLAVT
jgi:TRAP-type uncharacterized transport system substrate-binding protein